MTIIVGAVVLVGSWFAFAVWLVLEHPELLEETRRPRKVGGRVRRRGSPEASQRVGASMGR
ncbi:MAG TPA: hypothetical protein VMK42_02490 [Anaeromyxobacteraceae bacterium]|nr:hypothetical protein [Anaeromyxobacteraceae bacterium]